MLRRGLILVSILCLALGLCACSTITDGGEANDETGINVQTNDREEKIEAIGTISEISGNTYKIKLMGYDVNNIPAYLFAQKRNENLHIGDEVMAVLDDYAYMVDTDFGQVSFDTVSEYGRFMEGKDEVWYMADIDSIYLYENDGVFEGELGGIYDQYDENFEKVISSHFVINPDDNEPETGFFKVDTFMVPNHKSIVCKVTVTYDKETFEVISVK